MSKNVVEPETFQMTIWHNVSCWIIKATCAQAHARVSAPTHAHARTHAPAHTHTKICNTSFFLRDNSVFVNAREYHVIRTLPILFMIIAVLSDMTPCLLVICCRPFGRSSLSISSSVTSTENYESTCVMSQKTAFAMYYVVCYYCLTEP
jgi:hypothetical protein